VSLLHNAIVTIYSQVFHQPSGIRSFWFGVRLLSPLRPILRNGNPYLKFLGNAFTGERILQRPTPRHLWATDRPRICYPTCQQLPWCPAHGHTSNVASPTKKSIVIVAVDVKKIQTTKKTRGYSAKHWIINTAQLRSPCAMHIIAQRTLQAYNCLLIWRDWEVTKYR